MKDTEKPDLLTVAQTCDAFCICRQSVYKYIRDGTIPAFKNPAGKYMIPRKYLEDLINGCYNHSVSNYGDRPTATKGG